MLTPSVVSGRSRPSSNGITTCRRSQPCSVKLCGQTRYKRRSAMQRLSEIQAHFRDVIVHGGTSGIPDAFIGGRHPARRLAIHQRNYQVSLTDALLTKFPGTQWLLGTRFLTEVAGRFIREYPPRVPCIAEYGSDFPDFLGQYASQLPYVRDFARFEWFVGKAAIAVDHPAVDLKAFSQIDSLPDTFVTLQTGIQYLHTGW